MWRAIRSTLRGTTCLLWLALSVAWIRSYQNCDRYTVIRNNLTADRDHGLLWWAGSFVSSKGLILIYSEDNEMQLREDDRLPLKPQPDWEFQYEARRPVDIGNIWHGFGRSFYVGEWTFAGTGAGGTVRYARVRYRVPVSLLSAVMAWWAFKAYRLRRLHRLGLCEKCGYDLRATPDRCPECGTVPNTTPA